MTEYDGTKASAMMIRHELMCNPLTGQRDYYALFMRMPDGTDSCMWDGEADDIAGLLSYLYTEHLKWMVGEDQWLWPVWSGETARLLTQTGGVTPFWVLRVLKHTEATDATR